MAFRARKSEHAGAKEGRGAYWGSKAEARRESNRRRREDSKAMTRLIDSQRGENDQP